MLKHRILTALVLIPLFVFLVLALDAKQFCVFTGILVFWCAWEWSTLMGLTSLPSKIVYPFVMIVLLAMTLYFLSKHWVSVPQLLVPAFGWWLLATLLVTCYPRLGNCWGRGLLLRGLMGVMVLIPCWVALNFIHALPKGPWKLLFLFVLIWAADSGAYFAGKQWGKHKLHPVVSPGKTWEGCFGGLLMSLCVAAIGMFIFQIPRDTWVPMFFLVVLTVSFSVVCDLFESMLKRQVGVKDSGKTLPGHGGILDRIDSLTAAAPLFALGMIFLF